MTGKLAAVVMVVALGAGCADKEPQPETRQSESPQSTPSSTSSPPSSTPTADPTSTVTPATGVVLKEETSQLTTPTDEWERLPDIVTYASAAGHTPTAQVISLSDKENFASPASLSEQVKFHNKTLPEGAIVKRMPDVTLDGVKAYYVRWYQKGDRRIQHDIGLDRAGQVISVQMDLDREDPEATEALVATVLASFKWRD